MHYFYILYSSTLDSYYIGETVNVELRLEQHNSGYYEKSYTKIADDWSLELVLTFKSISSARKAELFVKKMKSKEFIKRLIIDNQWFLDRFNQ